MMTQPKHTEKTESIMSELDAIYHRRAVRDYRPQPIDEALIHTLLKASVQAPTAMHEEPWSFVVIQNQDTLNRLSESTKTMVRREVQGYTQRAEHVLSLVDDPDFHVFYNASTLIIIYSKFQGPFVAADCWLAAENLMLTACAHGLGTCVIGFAVSALNSPMWRAEFGISSDMTAVAPIIVGIPAGETPPVPRKEPVVLNWIK
jgi:nitroreductase